MIMLTRRLALLLVCVLFVFVLSVKPTSAQGDPYYQHNFADGEGEIQGISASGWGDAPNWSDAEYTGNSWRMTQNSGWGRLGDAGFIDLGAECNPGQSTVFMYRDGDGPVLRARWFNADWVEVSSQGNIDVPLNTPENRTIYSPGAPARYLVIRNNGFEFDLTWLHIRAITMQQNPVYNDCPALGGPPPPPEYGRLFAEPDELLDSSDVPIFGAMMESDYNADVIDTALVQFANTDHAYVHAVEDGTVTYVGSLADCTNEYDSFMHGAYFCGFYAGLSDLTGAVFPPFAVLPPDSDYSIWLQKNKTRAVWIENAAGATWVYIVSEVYVSEGDSVTAACILGETLHYWYSVESLAGTINLQSMESQSLVILDLIGPDGVLHSANPPSLFVNYPDAESSPAMCVNGPFDAHCLNAGAALSAVGAANDWDYWEYTEAPPTGRGRMLGDDFIAQWLVLDSAEQYTITVQARLDHPEPTGRDHRLIVALGDTHTTSNQWSIDIPADGSIVRDTRAAQTYAPDVSPDQYQLMVIPDFSIQSDSQIVVELVCVADTTLPPVPESICFLANYHFDDDSAWVPSTGTAYGDPFFGEFMQGGNGSVALPDSAYVSQSVTLPAGDYAIEYDSRLVPGSPGAVDLDWSFSGNTNGVTLDSWSWLFQVDSLSLASTTTADFTFTASNATTPGVDEAQVNSVCIVPADGSEPPAGYIASCQTCTYTASGDLAFDLVEMTLWAVCQISNLWFCYASPLVLGIFEATRDILRAAVELGRAAEWQGNLYVDFMGDQFVPWLQGWLHNIFWVLTTQQAQGGEDLSFWEVLAMVIGSVLEAGIGAIERVMTASMNRFYDLLESILYSGLLQVILDAIMQIVNLIIDLLNTLFSYVGVLLDMIAAIFDGFSAARATPTPPPGLPTCATEPDSALCLGFYVLDNTIFRTGGAGPLLTTVFLGISALYLGIWAIGRIRKVLTVAA